MWRKMSRSAEYTIGVKSSLNYLWLFTRTLSHQAAGRHCVLLLDEHRGTNCFWAPSQETSLRWKGSQLLCPFLHPSASCECLHWNDPGYRFVLFYFLVAEVESKGHDLSPIPFAFCVCCVLVSFWVFLPFLPFGVVCLPHVIAKGILRAEDPSPDESAVLVSYKQRRVRRGGGGGGQRRSRSTTSLDLC